MPVSFNKNSNALGQEIRTIPSYVADALIKDVVKGELPPGSRLKEIDLAQRFGVSRTVIREAIAILERDGYAERIPRAGARIRVGKSGEIEELFHIRAWLLALAMHQIAKHSSHRFLQDLDKKIAQLVKLAKNPDTTPKRYAQQALQLHEIIMNETKWVHLKQLFEAMSNQASWQVSVRGPSTSFLTQEHRMQSAKSWLQLSQALQKRDAPKAEAIAKKMLLDSYKASVANL